MLRRSISLLIKKYRCGCRRQQHHRLQKLHRHLHHHRRRHQHRHPVVMIRYHLYESRDVVFISDWTLQFKQDVICGRTVGQRPRDVQATSGRTWSHLNIAFIPIKYVLLCRYLLHVLSCS